VSVPAWPETLPQVLLQEGYSYRFGEGRLKTAMDAGPGKLRRRFSAVARPLSGMIIIDEQGLANLELFWSEDLRGGSLPFWFPNQNHRSQLVDTLGAPMPPGPNLGAPWLVTFSGEPPGIGAWGGLYFKASLNLSIMP
jgi:hypothetical protein